MNLAAFSDDQLVGSIMTWRISEERSATEEIFVLPNWRKKGLAKYMVTETLRYLKNQGKSVATLSVYGDNKKAIALYKSLGYKLFFIMLELGYDI